MSRLRLGLSGFGWRALFARDCGSARRPSFLKEFSRAICIVTGGGLMQGGGNQDRLSTRDQRHKCRCATNSELHVLRARVKSVRWRCRFGAAIVNWLSDVPQSRTGGRGKRQRS